MPANTPLGYPYPVGTDRVMDGDDAIHNLASAVDLKAGVAASGTVAINVTAANTAASAAVTFPAGRFTAPPVIVAGALSNNPLTVIGGAQAPTTTGVTLWANRSASSGSTTVAWLAIQLGT